MDRQNESFKETALQMKRLLEPHAVAIVGASSKIEKVGGAITRNALESGYQGKTYLINPNATQIFGRQVYSNLEKVPGEIDLVEIAVPAPVVPEIMEQAVEKGVKGAIIISSGFAEVENEDLQNQVVKIAKKGRLRVIGPNCFGLINTEIGLDLSFTFSKPLKGSIAFVSQSGAMCCGTLDWAYKEEVGFSKFINLGNKCDVDESDALAYLMEDRQTKIVAMYIEGIKDGRKLFETLKSASRKKPVVVLKAGVTESGARAALSHTGSIAGPINIIKAALKQCGAIGVEDVEELFDVTQVYSQPSPRGRNVAILSNAGGLSVMTTDWCCKLGLSVLTFPIQTVKELEALLPTMASASNPVDMTGDADYERYKRVLETISKTETIDLIISIFVSQGLITSDGPARAMVEIQKVCDKPLLAYWMGGSSIINGLRILKRGGIPVYSSPERVAKAAASLVAYSDFRRKAKDHY